MAKKKKEWGENSKKVEARDRKSTTRLEQRENASKEAEDSYWKGAGDGAKSKTQQKREEQDMRRQEAAAKRQEARKLAEEEEKALVGSSKKAQRVRVGAPKVTQFQLRKQQEEDGSKREEQSKVIKATERKEIDEETYVALVDQKNLNREEGVASARNVDEAIHAVAGANEEVDQHPERRRKAAYLAFEERELVRLKDEKPGLKQSQYKDMIFKLWQKSSDNPMNRL